MGSLHAVLAACIQDAEARAEEESWFLLRAVLQVLLASKPHPRALKANAAAATETGLSRAASLLKAYREVTNQELPATPLIHLAVLLFEVRPVVTSCWHHPDLLLARNLLSCFLSISSCCLWSRSMNSLVDASRAAVYSSASSAAASHMPATGRALRTLCMSLSRRSNEAVLLSSLMKTPTQ